MKNIFIPILIYSSISIAANAQNYSNRYLEIERIENNESISFNDTMQLIIQSENDIIWQRKGGIGYKGTLVDNRTLDFKFVKYTFSRSDSDQTIELNDGFTTRILKRQMAFDNTLVDHVNVQIPAPNSQNEINIDALLNRKWKLTRVLNQNGQVISNNAADSFHKARMDNGFLSFFDINNADKPVYQLIAHDNENNVKVVLENESGELSTFYFYQKSEDNWFLSDLNRQVFYFFEIDTSR